MSDGSEQSERRQTATYVVRVGEREEHYTSRDEALAYAKDQSREERGPVIVDSEGERCTYRYVGGELAQFVMETRR